MTEDFHIIIDFDSTFVKVESLEKLAEIALDRRPDKNAVLKEISGITAQGMEGKIPFAFSLEKRLKLFSFNKSHLRRLVSDLKETVTESIRENSDFIFSNRNSIYVISGGFEEYICPVVVLAVPAQRLHRLAPEMEWAPAGATEWRRPGYVPGAPRGRRPTRQAGYPC